MSFLDAILQAKITEIAVAKARYPQAQVERHAAARKELRDFNAALHVEGVRIIAEIKRASPSLGSIRPDLDPVAMARAYANGGAAALSVLTEPQFFKGSPADLQQARAAVAIPVLRKEFIIDPYQVYETVAMGADAILLIVRILDDEQLTTLYELALSLGLAVLTEVFDERDVVRANHLKAEIIGINNRDLAHFKTDVNQAVRLARLLHANAMPVALSGIHSNADISLNLAGGIRRFLIGEALMRHADPSTTLRVWREHAT